MTGLRHPAWCDPAECSAHEADADPRRYDRRRAGTHRSTWVELDPHAEIWPPTGPVRAWLSTPAAPSEMTTYLNLAAGDFALRVPLGAAVDAQLRLSALLAKAADR